MTDLRQFGTCTLEDDGCTTCGDVAVPVRVIRMSETKAVCEDRTGRRAEVLIDFAPDASVGDILLVHMGVAIANVRTETSTKRSIGPGSTRSRSSARGDAQ